jgi:hypothetical protein
MTMDVWVGTTEPPREMMHKTVAGRCVRYHASGGWFAWPVVVAEGRTGTQGRTEIVFPSTTHAGGGPALWYGERLPLGILQQPSGRRLALMTL